MKNNLGANLSKLRKENRYSRKDIAQILGVTEAAVGMYERGEKNPPIDRIAKIAEFFGVSLDELVFGNARDSGGLDRQINKNLCNVSKEELTAIIAKALNETFIERKE